MRFEVDCLFSLHTILNKEAASFFEKLTIIYQSTRRFIPKGFKYFSTLQHSNADLRPLNGLLPVSSAF